MDFSTILLIDSNYKYKKGHEIIKKYEIMLTAQLVHFHKAIPAWRENAPL